MVFESLGVVWFLGGVCIYGFCSYFVLLSLVVFDWFSCLCYLVFVV